MIERSDEEAEVYKELADYETPKTRAFEYALDLSVLIYHAMKEQGITQKELAERMGVSPARMSQLLNLQPNLTLKTIAKFELALGVRLLETPKTASSKDEQLSDQRIYDSLPDRLKQVS